VLGLAQKEAKRRGARTWWWVLIAGEGPGEDLAKGLTMLHLGTWRREAAAVAQLRHSEGGRECE